MVGVEPSSDRTGASGRSRLTLGTRLTPALLVRDLAQTLAFYERLGFTVTGLDSDRANATWAEVRRDDIVLQFHTDPPHGSPREPVCSGTFYLYPDSVTALAEELAGAFEFAWGPELMPYGMREFAIQDPNGYYLAFTEPGDPDRSA